MKWKDTLKSLNPDRYREFGHLHTLLENHVFPCLTDLSIGCSQDRKTSPNIRECISHAPSLVSLRVSYRTLTIDDIEIIHYSCPQLSTFEITYSVVSVAKEETLLQEMKAASTVTRLSIDDASIVDESCLFLEYMTQKYTNLIDLCFQPNFRDSLLNLHFPNQTRGMKAFISTFPTLLNY